MPKNTHAVALAVFLGSLCIFSLARSQLVSLGARGAEQAGYLTGDEPAYMMLTHSLVADGDFNLYNNRINRDGRFFGKGKCDAHGARKDWERGEIYSIHTPGLAILLAPAYAAGLHGPLAPRVTVCIFVNLLAALLAVQVFLFCTEIGARRGPEGGALRAMLPSLVSTAAVVLTPPLIFYPNLVYPELPAALLSLYALRQSLTREDPGGISRFLAALAIGFLPWLSFRFLLPALVLLWMLFERRTREGGKQWSARTLLALPLCFSLALFLSYQYRAFGSINPAAGYRYQNWEHVRLQGVNLLSGILGLILDRGHGILTWSPVYILSLTGLFLLVRDRRREGLRVVALLAVIYFPGATFAFWWGGFAPPPRYLVVAAPLLGGALCYALSRRPRRSFAALFGALLALSLCFGYLGSRYPTYLYRHRHIITVHRPEFMIAVFPSFFKKRASTWPLAAGWAAALLLVNGYYSLTWERVSRNRRSREEVDSPLA